MTRRMLISIAIAAGALGASAGPALAQGQLVCVKPGSALRAPDSSGVCKPGYTSTTLATESDVITLQDENTALKARVSDLEAKLSKVSYTDAGLNGLPTLKIDGANLQIVNGAGSTASTNGLGNLIIGYDERYSPSYQQTGSHDVILGRNQSFTSYAGVMGGEYNMLSGRFSAVFGFGNTVSGDYSSVSGGYNNTASGPEASVTGGASNRASGGNASVTGGSGNTASSIYSAVSGGYGNTASLYSSSVSGGDGNTASGVRSSVSGGRNNTAAGDYSSILGGSGNTMNTIDGTWPAGP